MRKISIFFALFFGLTSCQYLTNFSRWGSSDEPTAKEEDAKAAKVNSAADEKAEVAKDDEKSEEKKEITAAVKSNEEKTSEEKTGEEKPKKERGEIIVIPTEHRFFYTKPYIVTAEKSEPKPSLITIQSDEELKKFLAEEGLEDWFKSENKNLHKIDFSREVLIGYRDFFNYSGSSSKIYYLSQDGESLYANLIKQNQGSNCESSNLETPTVGYHFLAVNKDQDTSFIGKKEEINILSEYETCTNDALSATQLATAQMVPYSIYYQEDNIKEPFPQKPLLLPVGNIWGEWELFSQRLCRGCAQASINLPTGYPDKRVLVGITDATPFLKEGKRQLVIKGLYLHEKRLVVDAEEKISLCKGSANTPLVLLMIERKWLQDMAHFSKNDDIQFSQPFIPTSLSACSTP